MFICVRSQLSGFWVAVGTLLVFVFCDDGRNTTTATAFQMIPLSSALQRVVKSQERSAFRSNLQPVTDTIFFVPPEGCADNVVFLQKATNTRIQSLTSLQKACQRWEGTFQSELGVESNIERISSLKTNVVMVDWNITWIPPSALWLQVLGRAASLQILPTSYSHLSNQISTFSWTAVGTLIHDAFRDKTLRLPIACIQGKTTLEFAYGTDMEDSLLLVQKISEDLSYAQDLQQRRLLNRKCAVDLRVFLETARINMDTTDEAWYDHVALSLPWQSVPGSNPLDIDEVEEGPIASYIFFGVTWVCLVIFANVLGQGLF